MKHWREYDNYGVYLVTDRALCLGRPLDDVVLAAVRGGAGAVQLREKQASTREFLELARALVSRLQPMGIPLIINDRADIALASGAAGLHVGQSDLPPEDARRLMGENAIIGLSVETREEASCGGEARHRLCGHKPRIRHAHQNRHPRTVGTFRPALGKGTFSAHAGGHRRHSQEKRRLRAGSRGAQPCRGVGNMFRPRPGKGG